MFVIDLKYKKPLSEVEVFTAAHRAWLDEQYRRGTLICSGPKVPRSGGVLIACVADAAAATHLISQDPFYLHEIAEYSITEFQATKAIAQLHEFMA